MIKKKLKDIKVGDTVWVCSIGNVVEKYTVTYVDEFDSQRPYDLYNIGYGLFGEKPKRYYDSIQASSDMESTSTSFGMYASRVYFNKEDIVERFNKEIELLENRKQRFILENI